MYKELLEALTTKFEGVPASILGRIATKMAKTATTAEQVKTAVDALTWAQLMESYADSRATEATRTAVENYEAKYGIKDGVKAPNPNGDGGNKPGGTGTKDPKEDEGNMPAWAKTLLDSYKTLSESVKGMKAESLESKRRGRIDEIVSKLPEYQRAPYKRENIDGLSDEDFEKRLETITKEVDAAVLENKQRGTVFGSPTNRGGKPADGALTEQQVKKIEHRTGKTDGDAQPF